MRPDEEESGDARRVEAIATAAASRVLGAGAEQYDRGTVRGFEESHRERIGRWTAATPEVIFQ